MSTDRNKPGQSAAHTVRLNKYLSKAGICSRRRADELIAAGRILVDNQPAVIGQRLTVPPDSDRPLETVCIDGQPVRPTEAKIYLAFNKPVGIITTTDRQIPGNIIDYIGYPERIFPIGRLDRASEGLILLTNNGDLVNPILRTRYGHEKEYEVQVDRPISNADLATLAAGVKILSTTTLPARARRLTADKFRLVLRQGLNRQIRRMCETLGYTVIHLKRLRIMHITLGNLRPGTYRHLTPKELRDLDEILRKAILAADGNLNKMPDLF